MCIPKKIYVKLINHDCLHIYIIMYIMLAYLMLFAALSNAAYLYNAFVFFFLALIFAMLFVLMIFPGLLKHSLFISRIILQPAQCF